MDWFIPYGYDDMVFIAVLWRISSCRLHSGIVDVIVELIAEQQHVRIDLYDNDEKIKLALFLRLGFQS